MNTLPRFDNYYDLQHHLGKLFNKLVEAQNLNQPEFWETLQNEADQRAPSREGDLAYGEKCLEKADAFIDGLRHNFTKMGLLESEYLIDGYWWPVAKAPATRLANSDCRLLWKGTDVVWGMILYSKSPLEFVYPPTTPAAPKSELSLEKA